MNVQAKLVPYAPLKDIELHPNGWCLVDFEDKTHVVPIGEDHFGVECPCHPTQDPGISRLMVHHSFDGREAFETGERKPS